MPTPLSHRASRLSPSSSSRRRRAHLRLPGEFISSAPPHPNSVCSRARHLLANRFHPPAQSLSAELSLASPSSSSGRRRAVLSASPWATLCCAPQLLPSCVELRLVTLLLVVLTIFPIHAQTLPKQRLAVEPRRLSHCHPWQRTAAASPLCFSSHTRSW